MTVIVVTGIPASGKSTVAQRLAERFPRSVHLRGDMFRRMIVNDRAALTADPSGESLRQLQLRHRIADAAADQYAADGFTVVLQDVAIGPHLPALLAGIRHRPLHLVVLAPDAEAVRARDAGRQRDRGKVAYRPGEVSVEALDAALREHTPRLGLWLDTSDWDADRTADEILDRFDDSRIE